MQSVIFVIGTNFCNLIHWNFFSEYDERHIFNANCRHTFLSFPFIFLIFRFFLQRAYKKNSGQCWVKLSVFTSMLQRKLNGVGCLTVYCIFKIAFEIAAGSSNE